MRKRLKINLYMPWPVDDSIRAVDACKPEVGKSPLAASYTIQRLAGGCVVYWLGRGQPERMA
jgi:hypothetical protein